MKNNIKKISNLVNNQESLVDEKKFKIASVTLICSIIDTDAKSSKKYSSLLEDNFNMSQDEFNEIGNGFKEEELDIDNKVNYIKAELSNNMFQVMQFLKILNKFAILDGCDSRSYREFEIIRDKFLKDHY